MYKLWSIEESRKLEDLTQKGIYSYSYIGKVMNRSSNSCQSHAKKMKLKNPYYKISGRKYTANEEFWEELNPINCYWAGFISADGYIHRRKNRLKIELQEKDRNHLEQFKKDIRFTGVIGSYERTKFEKVYRTCNLGISSSKIIKSLEEKFNIHQKKSFNLKGPNVEDNYLKLCFFLGYLDGDGCIHFNKCIKGLQISMVCASYDILDWCKNLIDFNFPQNIRNKKSNIRMSRNYFSYSISGIKACVIFDFLNGLPIPKLSRKWQNQEVLDYVKGQKEKFPHLFDSKHKDSVNT